MEEIFNFHDSFFVVQFHWFWMLVALALGIWVGWYTAISRAAGNKP